MADTFTARTPGDAALALGVEIADLQPLIDTGVLRVLPVSGGGWITSDEAIVRAAQIRSGAARPPRQRPPARRRDRRPQPSTVALTRPPTTAPAGKPAATPPATPAPAPAIRTERRVPSDTRPDVHPNARLDMRAAAARLGVDEPTALRLAQERRLKATRLGRQWVTTEQAVRDYLRSGTRASTMGLG